MYLRIKTNSLLAIIVVMLLGFACNLKKSNSNANSRDIIDDASNSVHLANDPPEEKRHLKKDAVVLIFDSAVVTHTFEWVKFKSKDYGDTLIRKSTYYFSDTKGSTYKFYAFKSMCTYYYGVLWYISYTLNGYPLDNQELSHKYRGKKFNVLFETFNVENKDGEHGSIKILKNLSLVESLDKEPKRLVEVNPGDNLFDALFYAQAYDSIVIRKGIYNINSDMDIGLRLQANHVSLVGENGVFIYAGPNFDVLSIQASDVDIQNLYLAHTFATSCNGSVIGISEESEKVLIRNCDINGCGAIGINFSDISDGSKYVIEGNQIHNNHISPFSKAFDYYYDIEELSKDGINFYNNKIWNNGKEKTNEPAEYYHILAFGLSAEEERKIKEATKNLNIDALHYYKCIPDSILPIYQDSINEEGYENKLLVSYINPAQYSGTDKKGVLILNKPNDFCYFNDLNKALLYFKAPTVTYWEYSKNKMLKHFTSKNKEAIDAYTNRLYKKYTSEVNDINNTVLIKETKELSQRESVDFILFYMRSPVKISFIYNKSNNQSFTVKTDPAFYELPENDQKDFKSIIESELCSFMNIILPSEGELIL